MKSSNTDTNLGHGANTDSPSECGHTAAEHLYDAECALHSARQTHVDAWIAAAGDGLHQAVLELDAADKS